MQLQVKRGVACIFCLCVTGGLDIPFGLGPRKVKWESVHVLVPCVMKDTELEKL